MKASGSSLVFCITFIACALMGHMLNATAADEGLQPARLRCEYTIDPSGIDATRPRLSWILKSARRGDRQIAYQVLVAGSTDLLAKDQGDLWDSGKVESDESAHVIYAGKALASRQACFWKVRVWSALGGDPQVSGVSTWSMGLLQPLDWKAQWIDSHEAMEKLSAADPIKILHAVYEEGARKRTAATSAPATRPVPVDVTQRLANEIKNGTLDILVNDNSMGGKFPAKVRKYLRVEYEFEGKKFTVSTSEGQRLYIPPTQSAVWSLRKSFTVKGPITHATLYCTALGVYEMRLNGQRVGDHVLAPDWTDYAKRVRYQTYDVTPMMKSGDNALGGLVANGWYAGHLGNGGFQQYGKTPALRAQLEITYADGSTEQIATDASWKTSPSPILATDFMMGETYDARKEIIGWDQPGLIDTGWSPASTRTEADRLLESQVSPPVRQTGLLTPIHLTEPAPGQWTFDLGQNMVGVVRLKVTAPAGTILTLRHAEMLKPDGTVYTANLRGAPSVDTYTCKGGAEEIWQPHFTFHGFRYVELTGLPHKPAMDTVTGVVLGSDTPRDGSFSCSDPRINQLMSNIQWGQRGNYLSIPTDCPQRDERLGWMGDAEVFVRTATDNADVVSFFSKWLVDVDDAQTPDGAFTDVSPARGSHAGTPAWGDAGVICPWTIYLASGDKQILAQHLPAMTRWIEWCRQNSVDLIRSDHTLRGGDYGDWLAIGAQTPKDLIGTAYFAYSTHIVAQAYAAVGNDEQAKKYNQLFADIKAAFGKKYVADDGRITGNSQCCYAMALKFDLLPQNLRAAAAQFLVDDVKAKDWHLSTGFVGVSYLLPTLTRSGNIQAAYKLLLQDTFPSWLFSVKHGATTIWERWDGWTPEKGFQSPSMNSFNHYSLGSVGEWLYDSVAGIDWDPAHPGYKHIIIHPYLGGGLTSATATIGSPYGNISSGWKIAGNQLVMNVTIPPNTTATVNLPEGISTESGKPIESAAGISAVKNADGSRTVEIQSGTYSFEGSSKGNN